MKKLTTLLLGLVAGQLSAFGFNKDVTPQRKLLCFEENKGQIRDQNGAPRPDIHYSLSAPGMTVFIGNGQLHYQFYKQINNNNDQRRKENTILPQQPLPYFSPIATYRMDVALTGANIHAPAVTEGRSADFVNYYTGYSNLDGFTKVHSYQKIIYQNIYPDIDWVLYIKDNKLEHDFVVHPGADRKKIQLVYNGATSLSIQKDGSLIAQTPFGSISEQKPYAFQQENKQEVATHYQLRDNTLSFTTGGYNGTLVIDPGVDWATYYGGAIGFDAAAAVATDKKGHIYMTGTTGSVNNIATSGSFLDTFTSWYITAFLVKFDTLGNRIWGTYYGGDKSYEDINMYWAGFTGGTSLAVDNEGNKIYIGGTTNCINGIATPGSYQDTLSAKHSDNSFYGSDAFLAQFNADGTRNWATYLGGDSLDEGFYTATNVVLDTQNNNVYFVTTVGNNGMATAGTYKSADPGITSMAGDGLITQFNSQGVRQWATYYGGSGNDVIFAITLDADNNIYITGATYGTDGIASPNSFLSTVTPDVAARGIAFLAKLNSTGKTRLWGTYYGSNGEIGQGVACDRFGHVYMTGQTSTMQTSSINVGAIATPGAWQTTFARGAGNPSQWDGFLVQFDGNGRRNWGTFYGGPGYDYGHNVTCNDQGLVFMAGRTNSSSFQYPDVIATPGSHQDTLYGASTSELMDDFIVEFDTTGRRVWATYYGGLGDEGGAMGFSPTQIGLTCDNNGTLYLAGYTTSREGIATPGSYQDSFCVDTALVPENLALAYAGTRPNAFLARFVPVNIAVASISIPTNDTVCTGMQPLSITLQNKGRKSFSDILVTTIYTNNTTGDADTLDATTTQPLNAGGSVTVSLGDMDMNDIASYTVKTYIRRITDDSGIIDDTLTKAIVAIECLPQNIGNINGTDNNIRVYPNPTTGLVQLSYTGIAQKEMLVTIMTATGQQVFSKSYTSVSDGFNTSIDLSKYAPGIYLIRTNMTTGTILTKIIVK